MRQLISLLVFLSFCNSVSNAKINYVNKDSVTKVTTSKARKISLNTITKLLFFLLLLLVSIFFLIFSQGLTPTSIEEFVFYIILVSYLSVVSLLSLYQIYSILRVYLKKPKN